LLSALAPQELAKGIALGDTTILGRADGVGPKLAARLVTELKDKVPDQMLKTAAPRQVVRADIATEISGAGVDEQSVDHDAISALVNLGYGRTEAFAVVMRVREDGQEINVGNLISRALKELSRGAA
jgi:Holliday junction DNA helicase RuvA